MGHGITSHPHGPPLYGSWLLHLPECGPSTSYRDNDERHPLPSGPRDQDTTLADPAVHCSVHLPGQYYQKALSSNALVFIPIVEIGSPNLLNATTSGVFVFAHGTAYAMDVTAAVCRVTA
ncbi:hypothetical protein Cob_v005017 [Colletotrichum orbiculare MAFF 240422]|uniref:Uncharacterized protein n=1 Tax=Colletotrichum orbiculare (strain 104-T / ATCC 96160 / CBS 514.97 / LARS 414 / MAFF 240422) TaxID=1213857 RepID=A0A484FWT6_COLOR|nr:hypothetical protein Cob_v005017 [Colletotrichum orbiculare MAFF 240422]